MPIATRSGRDWYVGSARRTGCSSSATRWSGTSRRRGGCLQTSRAGSTARRCSGGFGDHISDGRRPLPRTHPRLGRRQRGLRGRRFLAGRPMARDHRRGLRRKAFEFAREADPRAELYYNDYNLWKPAKRDAAIRLVQDLQAKGLRVDGDRRAGALGPRRSAPRGDRRRRSRRSGPPGLRVMHHRARHRRPAARPRHVGRGPVEAGADPGHDQPLSRRPARGPAGAARAPLRRRLRALPEARRRARDVLGRDRRQSWLNNFPIPGRSTIRCSGVATASRSRRSTRWPRSCGRPRDAEPGATVYRRWRPVLAASSTRAQ